MSGTGIDGDVTSIEPEENFPVSIYPNPTDSHLILALNSNHVGKAKTFHIVDLTGKSLINGNPELTSTMVTIDLEVLKPGQYMLIVKSQNKVYYLRFIKH